MVNNADGQFGQSVLKPHSFIETLYFDLNSKGLSDKRKVNGGSCGVVSCSDESGGSQLVNFSHGAQTQLLLN